VGKNGKLLLPGSPAHVKSSLTLEPDLDALFFGDFLEEDLPSITGLDEIDPWRNFQTEAPATQAADAAAFECASAGSCGSSSPVVISEGEPV
jgi:hypothetical protein